MAKSETRKNIASFYIPFLLITIGFICLYSFLNWHYIIRPRARFITTDLSIYWLPFTLAIIPVFIFFSVKLRKINPGLNFLVLVSLISSMCIAPAAIIAQFYLNTATGKIATLNNIVEAGKHPECRYFTIKNHYVSKSLAGIWSRERSASRTSWDYEIFICCPLMEKHSDTAQDHFRNWLVKRFYTNFGEGSPGNISQKETDFEKASLNDFDHSNPDAFTYLGIMDYDEDYLNWIESASRSPKFLDSQNNRFFEAFDMPYEARNGWKFYWFLFSFVTGQVIFILTVKYILPKL